MHWNNRVWQIDQRQGDLKWIYAIKETFYNTDGEVCGCTECNMEPTGETVEELKESLQRMLDACEKPVLTEKDFVFAPWHKDDELTEEEK